MQIKNEMKTLIEVKLNCPVCKERFIFSSDSEIMTAFYEFTNLLEEVKAHVRYCVKDKIKENVCQKIY